MIATLEGCIIFIVFVTKHADCFKFEAEKDKV